MKFNPLKKRSIAFIIIGFLSVCVISFISFISCKYLLNFENSQTITPVVDTDTQDPVIVYYSILFDTNGGSSVTNQSIKENDVIVKPTDPVKRGYALKYWALNGKEYDFNTPVTKSITLKAIWDINYYTVTFYSMGGTTVSDQAVAFNHTATDPSEDLTKTGYTFNYWRLENGTKYDFSKPVTSNITLYAEWLSDAVKILFNNPITITVPDNKPFWDGNIEFSFDRLSWKEWDPADISSFFGNTIYFRGDNNTTLNVNNSTSSIFNISVYDTSSYNPNDAKITIEGNLSDLFDFDSENVVLNTTYSASRLFKNSEIYDASNFNIDINKLPDYCCSNMFSNNKYLVSAPNILSSKVGKYSCQYMFSGCTSLESISDLPATSLDTGCYIYMFLQCTSLEITFKQLPATTLANSCYQGMFSNCTSLITAPLLPAKTLVYSCYKEMFYCCSLLSVSVNSLNNDLNILILDTTDMDLSPTDCVSNMFLDIVFSREVVTGCKYSYISNVITPVEAPDEWYL